MAQIGKPQRIIEVIPLVEPIEEPIPVEPVPVEEPVPV